MQQNEQGFFNIKIWHAEGTSGLWQLLKKIIGVSLLHRDEWDDSKTDQLSNFHGVLITVGQKFYFEAGAGGTYSPGMCKQEAPSSIHWPPDPAGSCQHGWDDWGHFFYLVDLPEKGTGKHERWRAITSKEQSWQSICLFLWMMPLANLRSQKAEQTKEHWASTVKWLWSCFDTNSL